MTKSKAIRKFCLSCFCGSAKDIAFCTDPGCPLWEHRLGVDLRSTKGFEIMKNYCQNHPKDLAELKEYGVDPALYLPRTPRRIRPRLLNKGLLAFKSRQKEQAEAGGGSGEPSG